MSFFSVLVSLSYLLDFLIAVDFLGCDKLKSSVETNWREVLNYIKDIMVLENTTKTALEHIMKDLIKLYNDIELEKDVSVHLGLSWNVSKHDQVVVQILDQHQQNAFN